MGFRIIGVVGDTLFELFDARRGRRLFDVGEDERAGLVRAAADLIDAEVDEAGAATTRGNRRLVFGLNEARMPRRLVDGERLIIDVVTPVGRSGLEVRLQLERRYFDDSLALPGSMPRGGCPPGRTLRDHGLHARRFGGGVAPRGPPQRAGWLRRPF